MEIGNFKQDTFTDEEKAALGEAEPAPAAEPKAEPAAKEGPEPAVEPKDEPAPAAEPKEEPKTEPKPGEPTPAEKAAAEEMGLQVITDEKGRQYIVDEDGARIPPARFAKIYRDAKEGERTREKLDLLKSNPEGYFALYPDEKPATPRAKEPAQGPVEDIGSLTVNQPNGPYDGLTLREVYEKDPVFAGQLQFQYLESLKTETQTKAQEAERIRTEAQKEIEAFAGDFAKEAFGKDAKALAPEEETEVSKTIQTVLDWMKKTKRGGGVIADAYFLMNKEGLLKKVAESASRNTLKSIQDRKGPASIDTARGGDVKETGFEGYEKMSEAELTAAIDKMPDAKALKFFKEAPAKFRAKYPGLPWD